MKIVPLYTLLPHPVSWTDQMAETDYAVHYSAFYDDPPTPPFCTLFPSIEEAEAHARQQVALHPSLRCSIYDARGFIGAPIRDVRGTLYRDKSAISSRLRRWAGSILFFGGLGLFLADWAVDFRYMWASTIGSRMVLPGLVLLFTEVAVVLYARQKKQHQT